MADNQNWELIESDDDLITMDDWISSVKAGLFIDYDGMGVYASATHKMKYDPSTCVCPSMVKEGKINTQQTHIVWYNK